MLTPEIDAQVKVRFIQHSWMEQSLREMIVSFIHSVVFTAVSWLSVSQKKNKLFFALSAYPKPTRLDCNPLH